MPLLSAIACLFLVIGFVLLFFGNRLARGLFIFGAVMGAGFVTALVTQAAHAPQWQVWVLTTIASGVACLLATFLFRIWMGLTTMLFMATLIPILFNIWQDATLPIFNPLTPMQDAHVLQQWAQGNLENLQTWWDQKSHTSQQFISLGGAIGAIFGLGLGLALPLRAAAVQCACAGAGLVLIGARELVEIHVPQWINSMPAPRLLLIVYLIVAVLGFLAQGGGVEDGEQKKKEVPIGREK